MLYLPILRQGVPYKSLDVVTVPHYQTRELYARRSSQHHADEIATATVTAPDA